jgi:hypothetical protein
MVQCLADASIDASAEELDDGPRQLSVLPSEGGPFWQLCWQDGCTSGGGASLTPDEKRAASTQYEQLTAAREPSGDAPGSVRWLVVDGVDQTDVWMTCGNQSGYSRPTPQADPAVELEKKGAIAAAGVKWADCARSHGYPAVRDPEPPVADNWETYPSVMFPGDITPDELRALLKECPSFDSAAREAADRAWAEDPDLSDAEYWRLAGQNPDIAFGSPCQDGPDGSCKAGGSGGQFLLYQVLEEEQNRYLEELNAREAQSKEGRT